MCIFLKHNTDITLAAGDNNYIALAAGDDPIIILTAGDDSDITLATGDDPDIALAAGYDPDIALAASYVPDIALAAGNDPALVIYHSHAPIHDHASNSASGDKGGNSPHLHSGGGHFLLHLHLLLLTQPDGSGLEQSLYLQAVGCRLQ